MAQGDEKIINSNRIIPAIDIEQLPDTLSSYFLMVYSEIF